MTKEKIIAIVGAGGHARVVAYIVDAIGYYETIGVFDESRDFVGETIGNTQIVGDTNDLISMKKREDIYLGLAFGDNVKRAAWFHELKKHSFKLPALIHPSSIIDPSAVLDEGTVVCMGAIIGAEVRIGKNVIINTGCTVDHECNFADHSQVAPNVAVAGRVKVGKHSFIGIGSSVKENVRIGENVTIGAGSVVLNDMPDGVTAYGVPASIKKSKVVS